MTRNQAIEKVKKLLRLGKSSNVHEAAAAMRQAQALMRQHTLDEAELGEQTPDDVGQAETRPARGKTPPVYVQYLCVTVDETFGVGIVISRDHIHCRHCIVFIGPNWRSELAIYAYQVLLRQLEKDRRAHLSRVRVRKNRNARGDHFGIGWVDGVKSVLQPWTINASEKAQIDAFTRKTHPNLVDVTPEIRNSKAVTHNDLHSGVERGRKAQLNRGVSGSGQLAIEGPRS